MEALDEKSPFIRDLDKLINDQAFQRYFDDYAKEGVTPADFTSNGWTWSIDTSRVELISLGYEYEPFDPTTNPVMLVSKNSINKEELPLKNTFSVNKQATATFQWAITEGIKIGSKQIIKVEVPRLAEGKLELSEELNVSSTQTKTSTTTQTWIDSQEVPVPAFRILKMRYIMQEATFSPRFTARFKLSGTVTAGMVRAAGHENAQSTYRIEDILSPDEVTQTVRGRFEGVAGLYMELLAEEFNLDGTPVGPPHVYGQQRGINAEREPHLL